MPHRPIAFVSMPWHLLATPSIQLGMLTALAERADVPSRAHSLYLQFAIDLCGTDPPAKQRAFQEDYTNLGDVWSHVGAGEWVFAVPRRERDAQYRDLLKRAGLPADAWRTVQALRQRVRAFLERCADEVLAARPAAVGFTVTNGQTMPSLALAQVLKARDPQLQIVFGGARCEGEMGAALLRGFPCVDLVVRGKVERHAGALFAALASGAPVARFPGLCWREGEQVHAEPEGADDVPMDDMPVPQFDEYFARLESSPLRGAFYPELPLETSRGCWWGMKSHCKFCGLNGGTMAFRSKSPERVLHEIEAQTRKHGVLDVTAVDNILDMRYLKTLMPALRERALDLNVFFEVKANLSFEQLQGLRAAGVRRLQPGIESLSSPILQLMGKGTTALQNLRLLKWCRQLGLRVFWNVLYGFPGEDPAEYARMAELAPHLSHLPAPNLVRLMIDRFSPYFADPARHGLRLEGPLPHFGLLYDVAPDVLAQLSPSFAHGYQDGREPSSYVAALRARIDAWQAHERSGAGRSTLTYRRGAGFLTISDLRPGLGPARYVLEPRQAAVYLACDAGATVAQVEAALDPELRAGNAEVTAALDELHGAHLLYEEDGRHLALAVRE
jgi:ribosomal peptide maturation radical SAM protein 1